MRPLAVRQPRVIRHLSLDGDQLGVELLEETLWGGEQRQDVLVLQEHPSRWSLLQPLGPPAARLKQGDRWGGGAQVVSKERGVTGRQVGSRRALPLVQESV